MQEQIESTIESTELRSPAVPSVTVRRLRAVAPHEHRAVTITVNMDVGNAAGTILQQVIEHADTLTEDQPHSNDLVAIAKEILRYVEANRSAIDNGDDQSHDAFAKLMQESLWRISSEEDAVKVLQEHRAWVQRRKNAECFLNGINGYIEET